MSTDVKDQAAAAASGAADKGSDDQIKQVKGEMNRKLGALEDQLKQLTQAMHTQRQAAPVRQEEVEDDIETLMLTDPKKAVTKITENVKSEVFKGIQEANRPAQALAAIAKDFPEIQHENHELTKKAVEIYKSFSEEEQRNPLSYKLAVKDAANELGIKPMSKRSEDEQFVYGSGSGPRPRRKDRTAELSEGSQAWLSALEGAFKKVGKDINSKEVKERVAKRQGRNFTVYKNPKDI